MEIKKHWRGLKMLGLKQKIIKVRDVAGEVEEGDKRDLGWMWCRQVELEHVALLLSPHSQVQEVYLLTSWCRWKHLSAVRPAYIFHGTFNIEHCSQGFKLKAELSNMTENMFSALTVMILFCVPWLFCRLKKKNILSLFMYIVLMQENLSLLFPFHIVFL